MLTNLVGDGNLKKFGVRFTNQVWPGDTLITKAVISDIKIESNKALVTLDVTTENQNQILVITGSASALIG
jgi:acyl dehydratase